MRAFFSPWLRWFLVIVLTASQISHSSPAFAFNCVYKQNPSATWEHCRFVGADLSSLDMSGGNFAGANFESAILSGANLSGANLSGANLSGANLSNAFLISAQLQGARLNDSILTRANLEQADFVGNFLYYDPFEWLGGVDQLYEPATLTGATSGKIIGVPRTMPCENFIIGGMLTHCWELVNGYLLGYRANLAGANLSNVTMGGWDLRGANLRNSNLSNSTLKGSDLTGVVLDGANMSNSYIDANLTDASLISANLSKSNLTMSLMTRVRSGGITTKPAALPNNYRLINGYIVGPNANLTGADFSHQRLNGVDFSDTNLNGANFAGSELSRSHLSADLSNTNFSNAQLSGASLDYSTLDYAKFRGSNLVGATFKGVNLSTVDFSFAHSILRPSWLPKKWGISKGKILQKCQLDVTVSIGGSKRVGEYLHADAISIPSNSKTSYFWYRNGKLIANATLQMYKVTKVDLNQTISVKVFVQQNGFLTCTFTASETVP